MNENQSKNAFEPLFYIIQPINQKIPVGQNMQEIYHNKETMSEVAEIKVQEDTEVKSEKTDDLKSKETNEQTIRAVHEDPLLVEEISRVEEDVQIKSEKTDDLKSKETDEQTINAVHEDPLLVEEIRQIEEAVQMDLRNDVQEEIDIGKRDLRLKIIRLARYPAVVQKPICELIINGEPIIGQIESKRGEFVKIKTGEEIRLYTIDEIEELSIL